MEASGVIRQEEVDGIGSEVQGKSFQSFTTVPKRTFTYHDLDCLVYQKRSRTPVNKAPPPSSVAPVAKKGKRAKPKDSSKAVVESQQTHSKLDLPRKHIPKSSVKHKMIKKPKPQQVKGSHQKNVHTTTIQVQADDLEMVAPMLDNASQPHQQVSLQQNQDFAENLDKNEIILEDGQDQQSTPEEVKERLIQGHGKSSREQNQEQDLSQDAISSQPVKRVLRRRPNKQSQKQFNYQQNQSFSLSEYGQGKHRHKKSKNALAGKYNLNKIFQREVATTSFSQFSLKVVLKDFDFERFTEIFGNFDLVMVTQPIKHFFVLNELTKVSRIGFLFFWIQTNELSVGYHLMQRWGYDVVDQIIWIKTKPNYTLQTTENNLFNNSIQICLVGYKSLTKDYVQYKSKVSNNVIFADDDKCKPVQIYKICEFMLPGGKRLNISDMPRQGWLTLLDSTLEGSVEPTETVTHFTESFDKKCNQCQTNIREVCFHCLNCIKTQYNLCKKCFFTSNADFETNRHSPNHKWQALTTAHKGIFKLKSCFGCLQTIKSQKCYTCENCINLHLCLECYQNGTPTSSFHCHGSDHHLSLTF